MKTHLAWYQKTACGRIWIKFNKGNQAFIVLDVADDKEFVTCKKCLAYEYK